jgi:hypothetical protein
MIPAYQVGDAVPAGWPMVLTTECPKTLLARANCPMLVAPAEWLTADRPVPGTIVFVVVSVSYVRDHALSPTVAEATSGACRVCKNSTSMRTAIATMSEPSMANKIWVGPRAKRSMRLSFRMNSGRSAKSTRLVCRKATVCKKYPLYPSTTQLELRLLHKTSNVFRYITLAWCFVFSVLRKDAAG